MPIQKCLFIPLIKALIAIFFLVAAAVAYHPVNGLESRKLDEATGDQGIKCNPSCTQSPPPPPSPPLPSPPPPCPPPPALPPPPPPELPPPAPPKRPPTQYCPPPPSSFINIAIPPGNLYPIDTDLNGASKTIPSISLPVLVASVILGLLAFR